MHEHPNGATSWMEPCVLGALSLQGLQGICADQCMHGQEADAGNPIKKPTGFMSNALHFLDGLHKRLAGMSYAEVAGCTRTVLAMSPKEKLYSPTRCAR